MQTVLFLSINIQLNYFSRIDPEEQGHGMEPVWQHLGTTYPVGRTRQSWMTAAKPSSCWGASPGSPTPCQAGGRNAVRAPWSTAPGHMAQVWQNWEYQEQETFSIRKEVAVMEERCLVVCGLAIRIECQVLPSKAVPPNWRKAFTQWPCGKKPSDAHWRALLLCPLEENTYMLWRDN